MMAGYEGGNPLQLTVQLERGEHAYFLDRWWQQGAILTDFKNCYLAPPPIRRWRLAPL